MYDSIVLGAGVVGVNTAYWLAKAGHKVLVVDRQPEVANEASYANGGQIAVSHAMPWASPTAPWKVLNWLMQDDAPLLFRPKVDPHQWRWLFSWLRQCSRKNAQKNTIELLRLTTYSRQLLQQVRRAHQLDYRHKTRGILHFYRNKHDLDGIKAETELMQEYGCDRKFLSKEEALILEPALRWASQDIVGATYTPDDESGDAHQYCQELSKVCREMGVEFALNTHILELQQEGSRVHVRLNGDLGNTQLSADNMVVCMGAWSAPLLRPIGIYLNIYPAKGYSITLPIEHEDCAPFVSLTDDEYRLMYSRLGNELRVAGTGELTGYSTELNAKRCDLIVEQARKLFPEAGGFDQARFWTGLRPATPSNLPYIEKTHFDNLWLNTGHGTLGWTMGCGAGKYIADQICIGQQQTEFNQFELQPQ